MNDVPISRHPNKGVPMNKKVSAIAAGAIMMIASACTSTTTSTSADTELEDAVAALQDEVDRLQTELDESETSSDSSSSSSDDSSSSNSSESSDSSSDSSSSSSDSESSSSSSSDSDSSSSSSSSTHEHLLDEYGTAADKETAEKVAEALGCEGYHEMNGRYMPCAGHNEGTELINKYEKETEQGYPDDGLYDTKEEAEMAAEMAACEGYHEMDGKYMPCDEHGKYEENMEMINEAHDEGYEMMDENKTYETKGEALAAAAQLGCAGYHEMNGRYMPCAEHAEGEELIEEMYDDDDQMPYDDSNVEEEAYVEAKKVVFEITSATGSPTKIVEVTTYVEGESGPDFGVGTVCAVRYNDVGGVVNENCSNSSGFRFNYAPKNWSIKFQCPSNYKDYYDILVKDTYGAEIYRARVGADSKYAC